MPGMHTPSTTQYLGCRTTWLEVSRGPKGQIIVLRTPTGRTELANFWTSYVAHELKRVLTSSGYDAIVEFEESVQLLLRGTFEGYRDRISAALSRVRPMQPVLERTNLDLPSPRRYEWDFTGSIPLEAEVVKSTLRVLWLESAHFVFEQRQAPDGTLQIVMDDPAATYPSPGVTRNTARKVEYLFAKAAEEAAVRA